MKKIFISLTIYLLVCTLCVPSLAVYGNGYNAQDALQYAEAHWNDGVGLCAQFVSECLKAGGLSQYSASGTELRRQLILSNLGTEYTITLNSDRSISMSEYEGKIVAGDPVFYYCSSCESQDKRPYIHTVLCNGADGSGYMKAYSHNNANSGTSRYRYSSTCYQCGAAITQAKVYHLVSAYTNPPTNVYLDKNQIWYDIQDTIELTPHADNATEYVMSIRVQETWEEKLFTHLNGTYSISASSLGYGNYYAWITAINSAGTTDSQGITFSIVGAPGFSDVSSARDTYIIEDDVSISVSTVCAKGQVIGIDRYDDNSSTRLITEQCEPTFTIPALTLGTGNYFSYFSVYNGSGTIDTTGVTFKIVDKSNLGDNFYAYVRHQGTDTYLTNQSNNIAGEKLSGDDRQLWNFIRQADGSYIIRSVYDDGYMDVWGSYTDAGTNIYSCTTHTGAENQRFFIYRMYDAYYIRPAYTTGHMIDIGSDLNLELWGRGDDWSPQEFDIIRLDIDGIMPEDLGDDFYAYIQHQTSGLYLTNDYSNNNNIDAQEFMETDNQKWHFVKWADGSYTIESVHDGSYMDAENSSMESGTNIFSNLEYTGQPNQRFFIHYMYDAYYINPIYTSDNMVDMAADTLNIALWGRGQDWFAQEFNIIKTTLTEPTPTPETYSITLNTNGGTINSGHITSYTYGIGATLPTDVTREGYIFDGWYDNAECTGTAVTAISSSETGDKTYYAKWNIIEPVGYEIRFVNYDGVVLQRKTVTAGEIPSYTGVTPEKAQDEYYTYTFSGWSPSITAAQLDATYTAQFTQTPRSYSVTLNTNGGTLNSGHITSYTYGEGAVLPTDVKRDGYTFCGWYDNSSFTGTAVTSVSASETGDKVYYAKWERNAPAEYTITFVNYDGSVLQRGNVTAGTMPVYSGETPERPVDNGYSYTFSGWSPTVTAASRNATYTAQFTKTARVYSIKYDTDGGTINSGIVTSYTYGIGAALPTDVNKPGYIFNGWYTEPDFSGSPVMSISATESGSKVYYAKWTQDTPTEYLISFVNYDNSVLQSSYVPVGEMPEYYGAVPERPADSEYTYTFAGWEPEIEEVSGIATYTAKYDVASIEYTDSVEYDIDTSCAVITVSETGTYTVIFAAYDINGALTSIEIKDTTFDSKGIHLVYSDTFNAMGANAVKVMLWDDLQDMIPICNADAVY